MKQNCQDIVDVQCRSQTIVYIYIYATKAPASGATLGYGPGLPPRVRTWRSSVPRCVQPGARACSREKASGGRWDRPELHCLLDLHPPWAWLRSGSRIALSRSLKDLLHIMEKIGEAGAGFRSLTEHIDTTTPARQ